ncbi:N-acetylglucosamine-6-phosphate deacetylase [Aureimonas endophytica]|uniref:N-acetylglucosamine-6-phosphate deacetylase n=1 Tax=Aureimonas endophytica TaxID=2027858 RepID=A0A917E314_9HYPH|nr:N-acetylglucosamine-6-phosphate deacetylase [Aureimonas endophytica]GGD95522.1 N-acetylglucosamine-6-phosphate deacetylase [Aureimonas endophytica]
MTRLVAPDHLWLDGQLQGGLAAEFADGALSRIRPLAAGETPDLAPHVLMPAATDIQVNGAGGVMLNSRPTPEGIAHIVATLRRLGTGWVMPTLITTTAEVMAEVAEAAVAAYGLPGFLGIHLEGPHLNPARKGTHDARLIRPFEPETLAAVKRMRERGIPVMVTLAPEKVPAEAIRALVALGAAVSIGHTASTAEEAKAGLEAGAGLFTHLFNAMPPMLSREPGTPAAAINSEAYVGIIADGHHVAWEMIALACRARPRPDRMVLVSDAMSTIGGPDHFELYGERIEVRDGRLVNANGSLAGAHIDMLTSLRNLVVHAGLSLAEAVAMATDNPWHALGLPPARLAAGAALEEVVALDADLRPIPLA